MTARALVLAFCLWAVRIGAAFADEHERILDFRSEIEVHADASMTVRETIRVVAAGEQIRRGIYRDFPTGYRDRFGNRVVLPFEVVQVCATASPRRFTWTTSRTAGASTSAARA